MRLKKLFYVTLAIIALASCKDDLSYNGIGRPGYLTFDVSEGHGWDEGGGTRAGAMAPIQMDCSLGGEPLYLHTSVQPTMSAELEQQLSITDCSEEQEIETRGIRYTRDVFSVTSGGSPKISSFGIFGQTQDGSVNIFYFSEITPDAKKTKDGGVFYNWNVKEGDLPSAWGSGKADFYGYAPFFGDEGNPSSLSATNGLSMTLENNVPVLSYVVPDDVQNQLDILTAKHIGVEKSGNGTVVSLPFDHVMSAIKFKFVKGKQYNGTNWVDRSDYIWKHGTKTYNITIDKITINNVYYEGSWTVGDDPYATENPGRWTRNNANRIKSFSYTLASGKKLETGDEVDLNPDDEGNVFMMLPQTVPDDANFEIECTMTNTADDTDTKTAKLTAPLKEMVSGNQTNMTWKPGYTYFYTISMSDVEYVFNWDDATDFANWYTSKSYTGISTDGTSTGVLPKQDVFIRSYKIDSKGNQTAVKWDIFHEEEGTETAVGSGTSTSASWKEGAHQWIRLYDKSSGSYNTEVTGTHDGAIDRDADKVNANYFELVIDNIMNPIIDLSLWNYDQTKRWTGRTTANCYIVAGPGTYRIPLIYGNAYMNGSENTIAWNPNNPGANALKTFLNHKDYKIQSPFINVDLGQTVSKACLIWEEGEGTSTTTRHSPGSTYSHTATTNSTEDPENKYKHKYNIGTVVKVIEDLDDYQGAPDGYNTASGFGQLGKYLQFEVSPDNFKYGNAVVGILDDEDNIVWSWHIWITDPTMFTTDQTVSLDGHEVTFAGTNIGWVTGGESVPQKDRTGKIRLRQKDNNEYTGLTIDIDAEQVKCNAFTSYFTNCLYQFGRKDPMRGNVDKDDQETDYGSPRGAGGYQAWANKYTSPANTYTTVGNAIRNPNWIYGTSDGDLYPSSAITGDNKSYCNLWAANLQETNQAMWGSWKFYGKTIYDPSPVGYCVPPSRFMMTFARRGYRDKFEEIRNDAKSPITCTYTNGSDVVRFYSQGSRSTTNGIQMRSRGFDDVSSGLDHYANAFYHTATPYSRDENFQLHLYFYTLIDTHNKILGDHCEALSIMPVKDGAAASYLEEDQTEKYLTFTFKGSGALYWTNSGAVSDQNPKTIEYSLDNGSTWTSITSSHSGDGALISNVSSGTKILIRGNNNSYCNGTYYNYFYSTAAYELSGNIMSLINSTPATFKSLTALPSGSEYNFYRLFSTLTSNQKLMAADEMVLPATTLMPHCYHSMFENCTNLEIAPNLPATTGATSCYQEMFEDCSNLQSVYCMLSSPSSSYTRNWLNRVNSNGQFYYKTGVTWPTNSTTIVYGVPSGWTQYPSDE